MRVYTLSDMRSEKKLRVHGLRSEGVKTIKTIFFFFKIKNNFTTIWNKMKHDSTVFLLGYIFCAPINFNSLGESLYQHKFFDDHNSQDVYMYDHTLKFIILQENPSMKQTKTPNC